MTFVVSSRFCDQRVVACVAGKLQAAILNSVRHRDAIGRIFAILQKFKAYRDDLPLRDFWTVHDVNVCEKRLYYVYAAAVEAEFHMAALRPPSPLPYHPACVSPRRVGCTLPNVLPLTGTLGHSSLHGLFCVDRHSSVPENLDALACRWLQHEYSKHFP